MRFRLGAVVCLCGVSCTWLIACTTNYNTYDSGAGAAGVGEHAGANGGLDSEGGVTATNNGGRAGSASAGAGGASASGAGNTAGSSGTVTGPTSSYEAEEAFNAGSATLASATKGFSGTGYVDALATQGAKVVFAVNAATDAASATSLQYGNAGAAKKVGVFLNGAKAADAMLEPTPGGAFGSYQGTLALRTGLNTVAFVNEDGSSGGVSLDKLDISNGAARPARGAIVPFTEYEAEDGTSTGSVIGPDRTYGSVAAEASGRKAIRLDANGKSVEWTTKAKANALVIRYSMADAPEGGGTSGTLSLYVDGKKSKALPVTSKYAWVYGAYTYMGKPSDGSPHHYFDESRYLIGDVPVGAKLRLQRDDADVDITIDLIDTEIAPAAYGKPSGALSLTDFGAKADDGLDDAAALRDAIKAAQQQKKELFVPEGSFDLESQIDVDHVTIRGAGPWYTVFQGAPPKTGFNGVGDGVQLIDFAFFGGVMVRNDGELDSGVDGSYGSDLLIQNLWIEHAKTGIWLNGPTKGGYVVGCRLHDMAADGVNFHAGTSFSAVEHTHVRNTGDDGLAMYSEGTANEGSRFKFDTVRLPMLANGAAIYGGSGNSIEDLDIADTVNAAAGIAISTRFDNTTMFAGTTRVLRSTVTRSGGHEPNWNSNFGGLWIFADPNKADITAPILISGLDLIDSTYQGLFISDQKAVSNLTFENVSIDGAGSYGIEINAPGGGKFDGVTVKNAAKAATSIASTFTVTKGAGNVGW